MKEKRSQSETNRRTFLKSTGAAVIGGAAAFNMGFSNPVFARTKDILKIGLIGCGGRGSGAADQALSADPDVVLYAMADVFEDRMKSSLDNLKEIHGKRVQVDKERQFIGFDAYQKLIDSGVDVVLLTTPPGFRPDHLAAAVAAGKHIFCEKPMAVDAPGVRKVMAAAKKAKEKNLSLVSGFTLRYDYPSRAFYGKVLAGAIGEIKTVSTTRFGHGLWYYPRQPKWTEMEYQMRNWYYYSWLSGDFIVENTVHNLDELSWAMGGKMPVTATGTGGRQSRVDEKYGNIYDHFGVEFEYDNGVKGYVSCRQQLGCSTKNVVEIAGTDGNAFRGGGGHKISGKTKWQYEGEKNNLYQTQHDEFFASIRKGKPMNDGELMVNSTMLSILSRMVAYSGQTVTWEEAMNSNQVIGPAINQYRWDLNWPGPGIAIPGVTKVLG